MLIENIIPCAEDWFAGFESGEAVEVACWGFTDDGEIVGMIPWCGAIIPAPTVSGFKEYFCAPRYEIESELTTAHWESLARHFQGKKPS